MLLPPHIESHFREHSSIAQPVSAVRGLTDMCGELGESYLLSDGRVLHVHSRAVGKDWVSLVIPAPSDLRCESESPYVFLRGTATSGTMEFKFSSYENTLVDALIESLADAETAPVAEELGEAEEAIEEPTLMTYFAAALHAVAHADTIVDEAESRYIRAVVDNEQAIRSGFLLWQKLGTEALIADLAAQSDHDQRLCLMANVIELAMVDGTLRSVEKETVRWFRDGLAIDKQTIAAIYDVLVIKNRIAVFMDNEQSE